MACGCGKKNGATSTPPRATSKRGQTRPVVRESSTSAATPKRRTVGARQPGDQ